MRQSLKNGSEPPRWRRLRPRHIRKWRPDITPAVLRKWRSVGLIKDRRETATAHPFYFVDDIKRAEGQPPLDEDRFKSFSGSNVPERLRLPPLLRLKSLRAIGISRDILEQWERDGEIQPFRKRENAKALYRTWQFNELFGEFVEITPEPRTEFLRRRVAMKWLGVRAAEIESWVRLGIVRLMVYRGKGYYLTAEIRRKVLGLRMKAGKHYNASKTRN